MLYENTLTLEELKAVLTYDPSTGLFTRKITISGRFNAGDVVGHKAKNDYVRICVGYRSYAAHRLAWFYMTGMWPDRVIDHINGKRNDNRFTNLRSVSNSENLQNQRKAHKGTRSGLLGVGWHAKARKWRSQITLDKKQVFLGLFETKEEARAAYLKAKAKLHPFSVIT